MYAKIYKHTEIENTTLNDQQVIEKIKEKLKVSQNLMKSENTTYHNFGISRFE